MGCADVRKSTRSQSYLRSPGHPVEEMNTGESRANRYGAERRRQNGLFSWRIESVKATMAGVVRAMIPGSLEWYLLRELVWHRYKIHIKTCFSIPPGRHPIRTLGHFLTQHAPQGRLHPSYTMDRPFSGHCPHRWRVRPRDFCRKGCCPAISTLCHNPRRQRDGLGSHGRVVADFHHRRFKKCRETKGDRCGRLTDREPNRTKWAKAE